MADLRHRGHVAQPDAGRTHHANAGADAALQFMQQFLRAQHRAGQGIADPNGQRRDIGLALFHHVEMRIEGRGLEHLREGKLHLVGQRREVGRGNLVIFVLNEMHVLDQEVAPPRPVAEQKRNLFGGLGIDLASLGSRFGALATLAGMFERADLLHIMTH